MPDFVVCCFYQPPVHFVPNSLLSLRTRPAPPVSPLLLPLLLRVVPLSVPNCPSTPITPLPFTNVPTFLLFLFCFPLHAFLSPVFFQRLLFFSGYVSACPRTRRPVSNCVPAIVPSFPKMPPSLLAFFSCVVCQEALFSCLSFPFFSFSSVVCCSLLICPTRDFVVMLKAPTFSPS